MKIAIVGWRKPTGALDRMVAFDAFLNKQGYDVDAIYFEDLLRASNLITMPITALTLYYHHKRHNSPQVVSRVADIIEKAIHDKNYDVLILVGGYFAEIIRRDLDCLTIYSCEAPGADESYYRSARARAEFEQRRQREIEILQKSDYVIFPWESTENYVRKHIYDGKNCLTVKFGCYPREKTVSYASPTQVVSLGGLERYWVNMELLATLTQQYPYLDVYGSPAPKPKYHLRYKGFAPTLDVFYNYQFGLNTVSTDNMRRNHFSSRILNYLAYGLPVLFPVWQMFPHKLKGCVPYEEDTFTHIIEQYSTQEEWMKLHQAAVAQGRELDWNNTLQPLVKLVESAR
jgi:hypothetical protein